MTNGERNASLFQTPNGLPKIFKLAAGVNLPFFAFIRHGEMREDPFRNKAGQTAGLLHFAERPLIPFRLLIEKAYAAHTRIHLDMNPHGNMQLHSRPRKLPSIFRPQNGLGYAILCQFSCAGRRCIAQDQNRKADARPAKLQSLLQIGNGEPVRSQFFIFPGKSHRAVSIAIRLYNAADFHPGAQISFNFLKIMLNCIQVYFRPSAAGMRISFLLFFQHHSVSPLPVSHFVSQPHIAARHHLTYRNLPTTRPIHPARLSAIHMLLFFTGEKGRRKSAAFLFVYRFI